MLSFATTLLALLPFVAAQSTSSINLFLLNTDPQQLVASVITANPTTTQYLLTCPSSVDSNDCGYRPAITVGVRSGSIYGASVTAAGEGFTMSYECTVYTNGATSAVCTQSIGGAAANDPGVNTETLAASEVQFFPATVTAGLEKLSATASSGGTKVTSTGAATTSGNSSESVVTLSGTSSASRTSASSAASTKSSGAGRAAVGDVLGAGVLIAAGLAMV